MLTRLCCAIGTACLLFFAAPPCRADAPIRPLVFIPGILGSELSDNSGTVVWGGRNSLSNYAKLDVFPSNGSPALHASGLISSINVLGPFWTIHQYDDLLSLFKELGYVEGKTFFPFPYDWRLSNFETAKRLDAFIARNDVLKNGGFDVVAHSMGGIVTRIWMKEHAGTRKIGKAIYLGTPFQGSMNSLDTISNGWGSFANLVAGGLPVIRRVTLSFPSIYELFPTYPNCCRIGTKSDFTSFEIFDAENWKAEWLPAEYRPGGARRDQLVAGLASGVRLRELMKWPATTAEIKVTGDIIDTKLWLYTPTVASSPDGWTFTGARGDGTVPIWSAANDFVNLAGTDPSFVEHSTIFADKYVRSRIGRELVANAAPPVAAISVGEITTREGIRHLETLRSIVEPPAVAPGEKAVIRIEATVVEATSIGTVVPALTINVSGGKTNIALKEITSADDQKDRRLVYVGDISAPEAEDTYELALTIADQGTTSLYVTVAKPAAK